MFVSQMEMQEFKGIKKCDKPLRFSKFTLLIGRNNSGKSSVLEAISLLPLPLTYSLSYYGKTRIDLLSDLHGGKSSLVYGYSGYASIRYLIENEFWRLMIKDNGAVDTFIGEEKETRDIVARVASTLGVVANVETINNMVFFIPNDTQLMNVLHSTLQKERYWSLVTKLGANVSVARQLINECVDDRYTEVFFTPELRLRKEFPDKRVLYVKMKDLGDGVEKASLVALWLEALKPALVLWDDFEASAHPTLVRVLLNWLGKKDWQVVLSTHSIDVLNYLLDVKPKDAKVIQLKKTFSDVLIHQDLSLDELESLFEANQDPRMLVDRLEL